jgi:hypothetical protein
MNGSDWIGIGLLAGNLIITVSCLALVALGWWWMLPFAVMCGLAGTLVTRELWADHR